MSKKFDRMYLAQVVCKNKDCYQFVTESFIKDHPDMEFIEIFANLQKSVNSEESE